MYLENTIKKDLYEKNNVDILFFLVYLSVSILLVQSRFSFLGVIVGVFHSISLTSFFLSFFLFENKNLEIFAINIEMHLE